MTTIIGTNPVLPSGDTWNTTTYPPENVVYKYGGSTAQFDVVSGAVILNGGLHISGDTGIEFSKYVLNEVDPLFEAGDEVITLDTTQDSTTATGGSDYNNVLIEVISITSLPPRVSNNSLRVTLETRRSTTAGGSGGAYIFHKNSLGVEKAANTASADSTGYVLYSFDYENIEPDDYIEVYLYAQGYTTGGKNPLDYAVTAYVKNTSSNTLSNAWQSTYPSGIIRADS